MPSYTSVSKPTTSYSNVSRPSSFLLINSTDYLLINASNDMLIISNDGGISYTNISKPS